MARTRRNPESRRSELIDAATKLFFSRGYTATSIRDILDAVDDRTASPSVFYYYFESKEAIYQAVLQRYTDRYLQGISAAAAEHADDPDGLMACIARLFMGTLAADGHGDEAVASPGNLLFSLRLKADLTRRFIEVWELFIRAKGWCGTDDEDVHQAAVFIAGGIGEMVFDFGYVRGKEGRDPAALMDRMVDFCGGVLGVGDADRERYRRIVHGQLD